MCRDSRMAGKDIGAVDGAYLIRDHDPAVRGHKVRCKFPIGVSAEHAAAFEANTAAA